MNFIVAKEQLIYCVCSFLIGALLVCVGGANLQISTILGYPLFASNVSLGVGTIMSVIFTLITFQCNDQKKPLATQEVGSCLNNGERYVTMNINIEQQQQEKTQKKWWMFTGGIFGAIISAAIVFVIKFVGFTVYTICSVVGQMLMSAVFDWYDGKKIGKMRIVSILLILISCILLQNHSSVTTPLSPSSTNIVEHLWKIVALLIGVMMPVQTRINISLKDAIGSREIAVMISSIVSLISVIIASLIVIVTGVATLQLDNIANGGSGSNSWIWFAGIISWLYFMGSLHLSSKIGLLLFFVLMISGQIIFSCLSDNLGFFGEVRSTQLERLIPGIIIAIVGLGLLVTNNGGDIKSKNEPTKSVDTIPLLIQDGDVY